MSKQKEITEKSIILLTNKITQKGPVICLNSNFYSKERLNEYINNEISYNLGGYKTNKIKIKVNLKDLKDLNYEGDYYILFVDLDCLTEQKPFTNEIGTFYIKSFLPVNEDLWDYECELMDVEEWRDLQLKKIIE